MEKKLARVRGLATVSKAIALEITGETSGLGRQRPRRQMLLDTAATLAWTP